MPKRRAKIFSSLLLVLATAGGLVWPVAGWASPGMIAGRAFAFATDTIAFANETVYEYRDGKAYPRHETAKGHETVRYMQRCFVMCRAANQFRKFAAFDPKLPVPDDQTLSKIVRAVCRHPVWRGPLPTSEREVVPGYPNLRKLSEARPLVLQRHIGLGWVTYARPGNCRMFFFPANGRGQQERTHRALEAALARNDVFIGYLTSWPNVLIDHAILVYTHRIPARGQVPDGLDHYLAYDANHPESPRELTYNPQKREFDYQKDWDFVGGKVTVLRVYSQWLE